MQFDRHDLTHWEDPHPLDSRRRRKTARISLTTGLVVVALILWAASGSASVWQVAETPFTADARPVAP